MPLRDGGLQEVSLRRWATIAAPFVLVAVGAVAFYLSPWPAIIRLVLKGAHVRVAWTWQTIGQPAIAVGCWAAAIWLSLQVRRGG